MVDAAGEQAGDQRAGEGTDGSEEEERARLRCGAVPGPGRPAWLGKSGEKMRRPTKGEEEEGGDEDDRADDRAERPGVGQALATISSRSLMPRALRERIVSKGTIGGLARSGSRLGVDVPAPKRHGHAHEHDGRPA